MPQLPQALAKKTPSDALTSHLRALKGLLALLHPVPEEWLKQSPGGNTDGTNTNGGESLPCIPCDTYRTVVEAWRKALKWTDGLDHALAVMLASVTSTKSIGDQLWVKVIGPAACGKSTLCEALSVNREYIFAKSTIRGFHSGYKTDDAANEDNSLIPLVRDKTLVTKDGDTLLQSPNLNQILAEARDLYDGTSRTHYRNATSHDYSGIRMTWLLCGTSSLRAIDSSELGERFLDCVIMDGINDELEDEILWRVANRAQRNVSIESDGEASSQYAPELAHAMQLTGGYVSYLRENASELLGQVHAPRKALKQCMRLGKFVAFMRARPSRTQQESSEREFGTRLVEQHIRLANCLAVVLNRRVLDGKVMRRVKRVSLDTSRGQTIEMVACLHNADNGLEVRGLSTVTNQTEDRTRSMLRFLRKIGVVRLVETRTRGVYSNRTRWHLTKTINDLYQEVVR